MSKLISGKEALIALANGGEVQHFNKKMAALGIVKDSEWGECGALCADDFLMENGIWAFRIKPRTIALNGIEVPINRKKNDKDQVVWIINTSCESWYDWVYGSDCDSDTLYWDSEAEIKQVVAALREVFK